MQKHTAGRPLITEIALCFSDWKEKKSYIVTELPFIEGPDGDEKNDLVKKLDPVWVLVMVVPKPAFVLKGFASVLNSGCRHGAQPRISWLYSIARRKQLPVGTLLLCAMHICDICRNFPNLCRFGALAFQRGGLGRASSSLLCTRSVLQGLILQMMKCLLWDWVAWKWILLLNISMERGWITWGKSEGVAYLSG